MNLLHIKLKNGADLLAQENPEQSDYAISVTSPIEVCVDPIHGFFVKSWALLSATNYIQIPKSEVMFCYPASEKAYTYYEEFAARMTAPEDKFTDEDINEYEELFSTMLEAKSSIKH